MNTPINASPVSNDNRASSLNAVVWLLCALSASFVGPRFYSRIAITRNLGWDDWTILAALIFTIAFSICVTLYTVNGGGRHFARLNNSQIELATKYNWLNHTFAIFSVTISKVSVALLILRLLGPSKWRKWFLYILSSLSCLFGGLAAIFIWVQCTPVETLWIPTAGTCWDLTAVNNYDLFVSSWLAFADFTFALLPISIIWNLQLNVKKKVGLALLLGSGVFAAICAVVKASYLPTLTAQSDITWITINLLFWNAAEANIVIVAACIPTLRPLLLLVLDKVRKVSSKVPPYYRQSDVELSDNTGKRKAHSTRFQGCESKGNETASKKMHCVKGNVEMGIEGNNRIKRVIEMNVEYEDIEDTRHLRA